MDFEESERSGGKIEPGRGTFRLTSCLRLIYLATQHWSHSNKVDKNGHKDDNPPPSPIWVEPLSEMAHRLPLQDQRLCESLVVLFLLLVFHLTYGQLGTWPSPPLSPSDLLCASLWAAFLLAQPCNNPSVSNSNTLATDNSRYFLHHLGIKTTSSTTLKLLLTSVWSTICRKKTPGTCSTIISPLLNLKRGFVEHIHRSKHRR